MDNNAFISYYKQPIDKTQEDQLYRTLEDIQKEKTKVYPTRSQQDYADHKLKDEQYRSIRKFAKYWSKVNKKIFTTNCLPILEKYSNDYTLDKLYNKLSNNKIDKQLFKQSIVKGLTSFTDMNARIVLYTSVLNAVNSIDKIVTEEIEEDNLLGTTLTKLIKQVKDCGFIIDIDNKSITEYPSYINISNIYTSVNDNKTLEELDYIPNDVIRFATTMNKLKNSIISTSNFLQDRLKSQPSVESNSSDNTTIIGLLYYSLPNDDVEIIKARMYRVSLLNSIFQAICHYSFNVDYTSTINLLSTTISTQR